MSLYCDINTLGAAEHERSKLRIYKYIIIFSDRTIGKQKTYIYLKNQNFSVLVYIDIFSYSPDTSPSEKISAKPSHNFYYFFDIYLYMVKWIKVYALGCIYYIYIY
jgi:hypothetical protein